MSDFREKLLKRAQSQSANTFKDPEFVVQQLHRDDDVVKLWRCGKPQSSVYSFYICSSLHCLMVYGDMGECMWQRHPDMIPFIRGSAKSLDYFSEKVPRNIEIKQEYNELVQEWFAEVKQEYIDRGSEWDDECQQALDDIKERYGWYEDINHFRTALYESCLYNDFEDMPSLRYYTYHYLWIVEGLKWFITELDGGKVLPYVEEEKEEEAST